MEADFWTAVIQIAGSVTTQTLLFAWLWLERNERLKIQREKDEQTEKHMEYLLDQTEQIRRSGGSGI